MIEGNHIRSTVAIASGISAVGAVRNVIANNGIVGTFTNGIILDAASNNNVVSGNSIDPTTITNPMVNNGTGNVVAGNCTT